MRDYILQYNNFGLISKSSDSENRVTEKKLKIAVLDHHALI